MRNSRMFSLTALVFGLSSGLAPERAQALQIDPCSYAAHLCNNWYKDKLKEDADYTPENAYSNCPTTGVAAGWRTYCSADSQKQLKDALAETRRQFLTPTAAESSFMVKLTFLSYGDCKNKWKKEIELPTAKVQFAGFKENEDPEKVCKRLYPAGDMFLRPCEILQCPSPQVGCLYLQHEEGFDNPPNQCPTSCGQLSCPGQAAIDKYRACKEHANSSIAAGRAMVKSGEELLKKAETTPQGMALIAAGMALINAGTAERRTCPGLLVEQH